MLILIAAIIPLLVLAVPLWRQAWAPTGQKAGMFALSVPPAALIGTVFYFVGTSLSTEFNEVWSQKITAVRFYEFWNERVSCRHPIYETRTRTVTRYRTDGKGRSTSYTTTETYQVLVGHLHAYDVDDHPPHWAAVGEDGGERTIDRGGYDNWRGQWNNAHWVSMHRDYHTVDGNMWQSDWPAGAFNLIFPWSEVHRYENKVRVCNTVFGAAKVDEATRRKYPRPADNGDTSVLHGYGVPVDANAEWMFRRLNADLGPRFKVHNIVLLFDAAQYGRDEVERVKAAWQGPNKNELVTCVGVGPGNAIVWCDVFSRMDDTTIHSLIRQDVSNLKAYDANRVLDVLKARVPAYWHKKSFKDFDYLSVPVPGWIYAVALPLVLAGAIAWAWVIEFKMEW